MQALASDQEELQPATQDAGSQSSAAIVKAQRKLSATAAIKLIPGLVEAANWGQTERLGTQVEQIALALVDHFPEIARRLKSRNGVMRPVPLKRCPDELITVEQPRHGFDHVLLSPEALTQCEAILREHHLADNLARYELKPRHRVLLYGPPGNGKTLLAEAIARELEVPFLRVKYGGLIDSHLGGTGKNIHALLEYASQGHCVLFADEFDGLGGARDKSSDVGEARRITNQLLIELERLPSHCIFIAATNMTGLMDKALIRRFDFVLEIKAPTPDLVKRCVERELRAELTPGHDLGCYMPAIIGLPFSNLFGVVELCKRIRRDLALADGANIQQLIADVAADDSATSD